MSGKHFLRVFTQPVRRLYRDEQGAIISAELAMVGTLGVLATAVGLESVSTAVNQELNDYGNAISSLNQSFSVRGLSKAGHASISGVCFNGGSNNRSFNSQLQINEICGGGAGGVIDGGAPGFSEGLGVSSLEAPIVETREVRTFEDCSATPVTIQETRVPKTTTVTVSVTDSEDVSSSTIREVKPRCANGQRERVIHEEVISPADRGEEELSPSGRPTAAPSRPAEKSVPKESSKTQPEHKSAPSKSTSPKVAPKATPKAQIPKPQVDH